MPVSSKEISANNLIIYGTLRCDAASYVLFLHYFIIFANT